jgi:hypothetical protein
LIDAALAATSEVKWYISSVHGSDNSFAKRVHEGKTKVFLYTWRDDPRKLADPDFVDKKVAEIGQRKFNQEYACDFHAGNEDQMFPQPHLDAILDSHVNLGVEPTGRKYAGFDPGNGGDDSAICIVHGPVVIGLKAWKSSTNLVREVRKAFAVLDEFGVTEMCADSVGVGAGIEGIAQQLNAERVENGKAPIVVHSFKSSEAALWPERPTVPGSRVKNKNYYPNRKSQGYDSARYRAKLTFQAIEGDMPKSLDEILSISSDIPAAIRNRLFLELGQITCEESSSGKLRVDKYGGGDSPNLCDALIMATAPRNRPFDPNPAFMSWLGGR